MIVNIGVKRIRSDAIILPTQLFCLTGLAKMNLHAVIIHLVKMYVFHGLVAELAIESSHDNNRRSLILSRSSFSEAEWIMVLVSKMQIALMPSYLYTRDLFAPKVSMTNGRA